MVAFQRLRRLVLAMGSGTRARATAGVLLARHLVLVGVSRFRRCELGYLYISRGLTEAKSTRPGFGTFPIKFLLDKMVDRYQGAVSVQRIIAQLNSLGRRCGQSVSACG